TTLINSTVSNNGSFTFGGILSNNEGTLEMTHTIVVGNSVATDGEERDDCRATDFHSPSGFIKSLGHNLVGRGCPTDGPGDLAFDYRSMLVSDVLGPLQNNGGPTETHALSPGSPAIDAGETVCTDDNGAPLTTDQRGMPRPIDGNADGTAACDIGSFEFP